MSLKMKLVSMISAFVLVIGMLLIGVFAVERVQVDMGGSITFNADDVYARVTGSVEKAQVAPNNLDVTYSAYETEGNPKAWESLDLEFDSYATPIVISIKVENLSTERSLTVNLTDALTSSVPNLGKALQRDNGAYTSGTNVTLDPKDNGTSTTTFTITLSVTDKNQSLNNAQFDYDLNLFDENYKFPEVYDYFDFRDNGDGTVTLTDYYPKLSDSTDVVIPSTVSRNSDGQWTEGDTFTATAIADGSYNSHQDSLSNGVFAHQDITSVVLPDTIEYIGECAFFNCSGLASITLPSSLTSIRNHVFDYCDNLQPSITDDNGVKYLGSEQNPYLVLWNGKGITSSSYTVNPDCKIIYFRAFLYCDSLTSITLPEGLTSIGDYAFQDCSGLTSITLSEGLTSIGYGAFLYCDSLTSITLPSSLTSIMNHAFDDCGGLTSITVEEGNPVYHSEGNCLIETASNTLMRGCKNSVIPSYITSIGDRAFYGCRGLTSITLPEGLTSIGYGAFYNCSGLKSITLPEGLTSIGSNAFYGCRGLTEGIIDSQDIYEDATSTSACGCLLSYPTTVKVLTSLVDAGENSYITTNFPNVSTEVIDGKNYTVYSEN